MARSTEGPPSGTLVDAALTLAQTFRVLPLTRGTNRPFMRGWPEKATQDADQIRWWWGQWPESNVGVATGAYPDAGWHLVVVDVDAKHGGRVPPHLPETLTAKTPGGGLHLYYRVSLEACHRVNNAVGLWHGVDLRGERGQVAAPPSRRADGDYRWVHYRPMTWLALEHLTGPGSLPGRRPTEFEVKLPGDPPVTEGARHDYLVRFAASRWSRELDMSIRDAVHAHNLNVCRPPLGRDEVNAIADWAEQVDPPKPPTRR